ncbi:MAG: BlaI/MecI/CopY family transcriptional regulator [Salinivirgaceae bacterium]|jgi:BlaI family penicillinase repressor|nr:BlaI/MecI/CopY family transcriptional regulator [Salinivirgaceae bacterium]
MITLTKAEERIMQILWNINKGFVKDIQVEFPDPKPPYNTVSTIVRVLAKKEIIAFNKYGNTYEYFPLISKEAYSESQMRNLVKNYYNNSFKKVVNFFSESKNLDVNELDEVLKMLEELKEKKKNS